MSTTWRKWLAAALVAAFAAVLAGGPAVAGKPEKPPKPPNDDGGTEPGTIYFIFNADHNAPFEPEIVLGMNPDGSGVFQALPDDFLGQPSRRVYGEDAHRWWLTVWPIFDGNFYPNGGQRREVFAFRPDPGAPQGVRALQLTDLFDLDNPGQSIEPAPDTWRWARWSNDLEDTFISFRGADHAEGGANCIFRVPLNGALIEDMDTGGSEPLIGREYIERVLQLPGPCGEHAWSPDGNELAYVCTPDQPIEGLSKFIYVKSADADGYFAPLEMGTPIWAGNWTYASMLDWSPDGSRIAFNGQTPDMGHYNLWTLAPDGTVLSQSDPYYSYGFPRWSPDSRYMALNVTKRDNSFKSGSYFLRDVARVNRNGRGVRVLTADLEVSSTSFPRARYKYVIAWVP
jgi:hypothetical protein